MKKIYTLILIGFTLFAKADYWTQKADFPGINRDACFSFSIGTKGYVGCGRDSNLITVNTFWEYDQPANAWTQKADFAGSSRYFATGFAVLNKGYACFGQDGIGIYKNDVWQYDPATNTWNQKSAFPGSIRAQSTSFIIFDKAYITCGLMPTPVYFNDLWEYDPVMDSWMQKANFPGVPRLSPITFAVNNKGYVGAGYFYNGGQNLPIDFWEYDPLTNLWQQKADFAGIPRTQVAAFTISDKGYTGTGNGINGFLLNDFWQYNVSLDQWIQKADLPTVTRDEGISFSIGNKGYAGLGESLNSYLNDFWEYSPDSTTGVVEFQVSSLKFEVFPNPAKDFIVVSYGSGGKEKINLTIADVSGKRVFSRQLTTADYKQTINVSNLSNGIYFVTIADGKEKVVKKFMKE